MKKLKLDVHALQVESFEAAVSFAPRIGTVGGNAATSACEPEPITQGATCEGESCVETACATCLCPYSGPMPSCDPCSMFDCTWNPEFC